MFNNSERAYERRLEFRENFHENLIINKTYTLYRNNIKLNFGSLENYSNLFIYHFTKNNVPFLNLNNCKRYQQNGNEKQVYYFKIKKFKNIILYQIFIDGTKIGKKEIINIYLCIMNDYLVSKMNKKFIYNIASINKKNLDLNDFILFLCGKLKNEVESGIMFSNKEKVPGFLFSIIGDNAEIYNVLNLKISFAKSTFSCRVCDKNTQESNEDKILNYENYTIKDNDWYNNEVKQRKKSKKMKNFIVLKKFQIFLF